MEHCCESNEEVKRCRSVEGTHTHLQAQEIRIRNDVIFCKKGEEVAP